MEEGTRRECCACGVHTMGYACGNCGSTELALVLESRGRVDRSGRRSRELRIVPDPSRERASNVLPLLRRP